MGIRGLQSFVEKHCPKDCFELVSIEKLARDFRESEGKTPVIAFDVAPILPYIYEGLDWVAGGQFTEFLKKLESFVRHFTDLDIHPVFFFSGVKHDNDSHYEWMEKNLKKLEKVRHLFEDLQERSAKDVNSNPNHFRFPTNLGISHYLKEKLNVEVQIVARHKSEIAEYAKKNNCLAIFGQDTDFLIFEGAKYYLSALHFKTGTMMTQNYNRKNLAKFLEIRPSQLPIFAVLAGSNSTSEDLRAFHQHLCGRYIRFEKLFPALGKYIQRLPTGERLIDELPNIAKDVFNDRGQQNKLLKCICAFVPRPEVDSGETNWKTEWEEILFKTENLHKKCLISKVILNIMTGKPYRCSTVTENTSRRDLPPAASVMRPLRQRLYGILMTEKPSAVLPYLIEEWTTERGEAGIRDPHKVRPIRLSDHHHPGLLALWGDDRSDEMQTIRWKLFAGAISKNLDHNDLKDLPEFVILPFAALYYLKDKNVLRTSEIEALLILAIILPSKSSNELRRIPTDPIDLRAVHVGTIFMCSLQTTVRLLSACGFPLPRERVFQYAYFDGKLFQEKYRQIQNGASHAALFEDKALQLDTFRAVRHTFVKES